METVGGVLIKIQNSRNPFLEQFLTCGQKKKKVYCLTANDNLYNHWRLVNLPSMLPPLSLQPKKILKIVWSSTKEINNYYYLNPSETMMAAAYCQEI